MTRLVERIALNLKAARGLAGLSQERLAARAGVSTRTVARLERGDTANPRSDEFDRIAVALGTTTDALMGIDDDAPATDADEPTDEDLDAEMAELTSDTDIFVAFMSRVRDPKQLSRTAKLVILEDLRRLQARQRRKG